MPFLARKVKLDRLIGGNFDFYGSATSVFVADDPHFLAAALSRPRWPSGLLFWPDQKLFFQLCFSASDLHSSKQSQDDVAISGQAASIRAVLHPI